MGNWNELLLYVTRQLHTSAEHVSGAHRKRVEVGGIAISSVRRREIDGDDADTFRTFGTESVDAAQGNGMQNDDVTYSWRRSGAGTIGCITVAKGRGRRYACWRETSIGDGKRQGTEETGD